MHERRERFPPLYRVPEHDNEAGIGLQGVDKILDEEGGLPLSGVVIEIDPGIVVPHGGCAGFSWEMNTHMHINKHAHALTQTLRHTHIQEGTNTHTHKQAHTQRTDPHKHILHIELSKHVCSMF